MSAQNPRRIHTMSLQLVVTADEYYPSPKIGHVGAIGAGKGYGVTTNVALSIFQAGEAVLIHSVYARSEAGSKVIINDAISGAAADAIELTLAANVPVFLNGPYYFDNGFHVEKTGAASVSLVISYSIVAARE